MIWHWNATFLSLFSAYWNYHNIFSLCYTRTHCTFDTICHKNLYLERRREDRSNSLEKYLIAYKYLIACKILILILIACKFLVMSSRILFMVSDNAKQNTKEELLQVFRRGSETRPMPPVSFPVNQLIFQDSSPNNHFLILESISMICYAIVRVITCNHMYLKLLAKWKNGFFWI